MKKFIVSLLVVLLTLALLPQVAFAISVPDSGPFILRVDAYRHVLETDDLLIVVRYNVPYATVPDKTITQAYIGRLMDGTTELARTSPYAFYKKGYGHGLFSLYLDSVSAPVWGGAYTVELRGNPTLDWTPAGSAPPVATTSSINWRGTATAAATQTLMYSHLIAYADELSNYWGVLLTVLTPAGLRLSSSGAAYFENAIPRLRTMCAALFAEGVIVPAYEDLTWRRTLADATVAAWPFDAGGISAWFGLPANDEVFRTLVAFIIVFFLCALIVAKTNRPDFAMLAGYGLLIVLAVPGWISPVLVAGFAFLSVVATGLVFVLGKTA